MALGIAIAIATAVVAASGCSGELVSFGGETSAERERAVAAVYEFPEGIYSTRSEALRPRYARSTGFFVADGKLYDARGGELVIRGVNNPHVWYDSYGRDYAYGALDAIAGYGANTVRVVWQTDGDVAQLGRIIERVVALEMIPMVELHDVTGNSDRGRLLEMAEYYLRSDVRSILEEHERYLLVNLANEWSGSDFYGAYREAVERLRDGGLHHTLVIDANGWGQNIDAILEHGTALLAADPEHNLLFDVHMYESFADPTRITSKLRAAADARLPLVVGEFGFQHGNPVRAIDFRTIMAECERLGIGYIPWSWKGNNSAVEYLDMSRDWAGSELTEWGRSVIFEANGINQTARKASVFLPDQDCVPDCAGRECGPDPECGLSCGAACSAGQSCSAAGLCTGGSAERDCPDVGGLGAVGAAAWEDAREISGLVASRVHPGVLWVHNDSGDSPRIFAMSDSGRHLGTYALAGASARDYEDIAADDTYLYVADIGDNSEQRESVVVYRVAEPEVSAQQSTVKQTLVGVEALELLYPDRAHNAETLLVDPASGDLFVVTKEGSGNSRVFRAAAPLRAGDPSTLELVATLPFGSASLPGNRYATGGDVSASGDAVLIRSYDRAFWWWRERGEPLWRAFDRDACAVPLSAEPQGEAIGFVPDGRGYLTVSEGGSAPIYGYREQDAPPPSPQPPPSPVPDPDDPPAANWILRNDYHDQELGSQLTENDGVLRLHHRQWGREYVWLVQSGVTVSVAAGRAYDVSLEFRQDDTHPLDHIEVALAPSWGSGGPELAQPRVAMSAAAVGADGYRAFSARMTAERTGVLHLALEVDFAAKPSTEVDHYLRGVAVNAAPDSDLAGNWILRNDYEDQTIGSGLSNQGGALRFHHRQWGMWSAWLIQNGATYDLVAGNDYVVRLDFLDDGRNPTARADLGLADGWGSKHPWLVQATTPVTLPAPGSGYGAAMATFTAEGTGPVHLALQLHWDEKPPVEVDYYLKNVSLTTATRAAGEQRVPRGGQDREATWAGCALGTGSREDSSQGSPALFALILGLVMTRRSRVRSRCRDAARRPPTSP